MSEPSVREVTGSELIGEDPEPPKRRLTAADFPGLKIEPLFPGATYGRHPVSKKFVSLKTADQAADQAAAGVTVTAADQAAGQAAETAASTADINPPKAADTPAAAAPAAAAASTADGGGPETAASPGGAAGPERPAPDFSDLGAGGAAADAAAGAEREPEQTAEEHKPMASLIFDSVVGFLAMIFGAEWMPTSKDEKSSVVESIAQAFAYIGFVILNPIQRMWIRCGLYCMPRFHTIIRWWKNRVKKKFDSMKRADVADPKVAGPGAEPRPAAEAEENAEFVS
jgi:hypothetical protein